MKFPSPEYNRAVAAMCHGKCAEAEQAELRELLLQHQDALDDYLLQVSLHARLASQPELFLAAAPEPDNVVPFFTGPRKALIRALAATGIALFVVFRLLIDTPSETKTVAHIEKQPIHTQVVLSEFTESIPSVDPEAAALQLRLESLHARLIASQQRLEALGIDLPSIPQ